VISQRAKFSFISNLEHLINQKRISAHRSPVSGVVQFPRNTEIAQKSDQFCEPMPTAPETGVLTDASKANMHKTGRTKQRRVKQRM
jgi:hypothetical protein